MYYHCSEFRIFRSLNGLHFSVLSLYPSSVKNQARFRLHFSDHQFPPVASKKCYVVSSDLDFELSRISDPLAKSGYKFVNILKAPITKLEYSWNKQITKLKYSWNKQMNKTSSRLTNFTCFFLLLFFELLNPGRDEQAYLSFTPSFSQFHHRKSIYLKRLHQE